MRAREESRRRGWNPGRPGSFKNGPGRKTRARDAKFPPGKEIRPSGSRKSENPEKKIRPDAEKTIWEGKRAFGNARRGEARAGGLILE
jgi:hypothetical protein